MEVGVLLEIITTVGFPIACVIALFWFIYKLQNESVKREERYIAIIEEYGTKLAEITTAINAINDKIDRYHMTE